jgi:DNA-binding MarR family transcriptional regulator
MQTRRPENDVRTVLDALRRIVRELRLSAAAAEGTLGLSGAQLFALALLGEASARSVGELARRAHTDQSSISVVIRRLCERGLVARHTAPSDARRVELRLTASGRRVLGRAPRAAQASLLAALAGFSRARLAQLASTLDELVARMGAAADTAPLFFEDQARRRRRSERKGNARTRRDH